MSKAWHSLLAWLLMRDALAKAREEDARIPLARQIAIRAARAHAEAANALLDSGRALPPSAILTLYQESLLWLLSENEAAKKALAAAIESSPEPCQAAGQNRDGQKEAAWEQLRRALSLKGRLQSSDESDAKCLLRDVEMMRDPLQGLIVRAESLYPSKGQNILRTRRRRVGGAMTAVAAVLAATTALAMRSLFPKDLAQDKPWNASSALPIVFKTDLLFHTREEQNPWVEFDLLRPTVVHRLHVRNRSDCCLESAVPLVVTVSLDRSAWQQVATTNVPFKEWDPGFPPVETRFVRLWVPRLTTFHLEDVKVY